MDSNFIHRNIFSLKEEENSKMKKFFEKMDVLPIVRLLQLLAVLIFAFSVLNLGISANRYFEPNYAGMGRVIGGIYIVLGQLGLALFQPAILLALAEIIKLMKEKNAKNP